MEVLSKKLRGAVIVANYAAEEALKGPAIDAPRTSLVQRSPQLGHKSPAALDIRVFRTTKYPSALAHNVVDPCQVPQVPNISLPHTLASLHLSSHPPRSVSEGSYHPVKWNR